MKYLTTILALLLTLQVVYSRHLEERQEQRAIQEYIGYVESITNTMYTDALTLTRTACAEIVNEIPVGARGDLTAALKKFVDDAVRAESSTDYNVKKEVIDSLGPVMKNSFQAGASPTPESMMVAMKLFPIAFAAKKIDDTRTEKLINASKNLESSFSPNGISRNQRLFEKIRSFENVNDDNSREQNVKELLALKA